APPPTSIIGQLRGFADRTSPFIFTMAAPAAPPIPPTRRAWKPSNSIPCSTPKRPRWSRSAPATTPGSDKPPHGLLGTVGWVASTLVDSSEDWVDDAV